MNEKLPPAPQALILIRTGPNTMEVLSTEEKGPVAASKAKAIMSRHKAWSEGNDKAKVASKAGIKGAAKKKKKAAQIKEKEAVVEQAKAEKKAKGLATRNRKRKRKPGQPPPNNRSCP